MDPSARPWLPSEAQKTETNMEEPVVNVLQLVFYNYQNIQNISMVQRMTIRFSGFHLTAANSIQGIQIFAAERP